MQVLLIADDKPLPLNEWRDWMIWCPSQCYFHTQRDGVDYVLYLRWRWDDPWEGHIIKHATSEQDMVKDQAVWSADLFEQHDLEFTDEEVEEAKVKLLELFEQQMKPCPHCGGSDYLPDKGQPGTAEFCGCDSR